jgi:hypothetical protein
MDTLERFFVGMTIVGFVGLLLAVALSVYPNLISYANNAAPAFGELQIGPALVPPKPADGDSLDWCDRS